MEGLMKIMKLLVTGRGRIFIPLLGALLVAACGGGSSSSSGNNPGGVEDPDIPAFTPWKEKAHSGDPLTIELKGPT